MSEPETSNDDLFRGFMDDLIDVVPGQSTDVFSNSLMTSKSGKPGCAIYGNVSLFGLSIRIFEVIILSVVKFVVTWFVSDILKDK